ncbi:MAG TPA: outer membrane lipoprotein carrier protein LolA [Opitutus sp.]|nr:outer membrane lipoprotein carrier protein LolA [Opitutus sp.]
MNPLRRWLFLLTATLALQVAAAPLAPPFPPEWKSLFDALSAPIPRFATFEEERSFAFKKQPVVLQGELRQMPGHGVSLTYTEPNRQTVIIDDAGVLMRNEHGRDRALPARRTPATVAHLGELLQFDVTTLARNFELAGDRDGERWILALKPLDGAAAEATGAILLRGHRAQIDEIVLSPERGPRIRISITAVRTGQPFAAAELARYFR